MSDHEPITEAEIAEWAESGSVWYCHPETQRLIAEVQAGWAVAEALYDLLDSATLNVAQHDTCDNTCPAKKRVRAAREALKRAGRKVP